MGRVKTALQTIILGVSFWLGLVSPAYAQVCQNVLTSTAPSALPQKPFSHLDPHSEQQWTLITGRLAAALEMHLTANLPILRPAKDSSILPDLERAGFLDESGRLPEKQQLQSSVLRLLQYFQNQKNDALRSSEITEAQVIEPGFIFARAFDDHLIVLPFGAEVPRGYFPKMDSPDLIEGKTFTRFLGEGFQVVQVSNDKKHSWMSFHDIAHLFGYYSDFTYMSTVRRLAQREPSTPGTVFNFQNMANFYFFEVFSWVNLKAVEEFERTFNLSALRECSDADCIRDLLYENGQVKPVIGAYLKENFNSLLRPLGGSLLSLNSVMFMGEAGRSATPYQIAEGWVNRGQADLFVEFLYQMARTDIASHAEVILNGPSMEFCSFYYEFALVSAAWERLCPTHF